MLYIHSNFHENVSAQIYELLKNQLEHVFNNSIFTEYINQVIISSIENALQMFYKEIAPIRSYKDTMIIKDNENDIYRNYISEKINYLNSVPQPQQRTSEWYAFRQNVLTASNIWKVFSSQNTKNQLIYEKCIPFDIDKYNTTFTNTTSSMHWGQRFEPVSIMYYENTYNTKVGDFGCIPHKTIKCLAASPDGINISNDSGRYGRMLEVKNIVNRVIDGVPKMEYWIQMQVQLEVCDLDECDFLETRFIEYENEEMFNTDFSISSFHKGLIMYFNDNGKPLYEYSKWGANRNEIDIWENEMIEKHSNIELIQYIYWKLEEVSCVLVMRNKLWFNAAKPMIEEIWEIIAREKESGEYKKREPKKKMSKNFTENTKCLININLLNDLGDIPEEKELENIFFNNNN
jgi:putative phage-type endonuclease